MKNNNHKVHNKMKKSTASTNPERITPKGILI